MGVPLPRKPSVADSAMSRNEMVIHIPGLEEPPLVRFSRSYTERISGQTMIFNGIGKSRRRRPSQMGPSACTVILNLMLSTKFIPRL